MSSQHNALIESLECYMEEVVASFEDFVKKSLLLFSVGVCTVVVMLVYVLKLLTERGSFKKSNKISNMWHLENEKMYPTLSTHEVTVHHMKPKLTCTSANTLVMKSIWPSYEEQVLRNIGFSNCHKCMQIGKSFDDLHTSIDNLHTQITLSSDRNRQRSITITPVCRRRRDLSLPSRISDNLQTPPLERIWNLPKVPPVPIPIFDNRDESQPYTEDECKVDIKDESKVVTRKKSNICHLPQRHESKSAYKKDSQRRVQFMSSINILTRQNKNTNLPSVSWRPRDPVLEFSDRGKQPLSATPGLHRQLTTPIRRCPSPATTTIIPNCPKPSPQTKIPQKFGAFPRHGDYLRTKK